MTDSSDTAPQFDSHLSSHQEEWIYVGFWARVGASIIDSILVMMVTVPLLYSIYGADYFISTEILRGPGDLVISYVLPAVAVILFWYFRSATPGKMVIGAKIVDAQTGEQPSTGQLIGRYAGYFVSMFPLMLGLIWVGLDKKKQGWHDKLARTVVVKVRSTQ